MASRHPERLRVMLQRSITQMSYQGLLGASSNIITLYPAKDKINRAVLNGELKRWFGTSVRLASKEDRYSSFLEENRMIGENIYGKYKKVAPMDVSERLEVPANIKLPDYWYREDGIPPARLVDKPHIKTKEEIEIMKESCRLAKYVLEKTLEEAKVGVTTDELDKYAHNLITKNNAFPSPLTYRKFPKSICTSVNNVACHGIPDNRKLLDGDIISVDVMVYKNGYHGDCCGTTLIGNVDQPGRNLVRLAKECLMEGINQCGPNVPIANIGKAIERFAEQNEICVLHVFTGHGVGLNLHEKPDIYHVDGGCKLETMKPGMTFTIEPVIAQGLDLVLILEDGWTAVTMDGARAAQFEETLAITESGYEILTKC